MVHIVPGILSLMQYLQAIKDKSTSCRLGRCLSCGKAKPWLHGGYLRKADRSCSAGKSVNPVFIQRFFCHHCRKTDSVLPECMAPHRWYLWEVQQAALLLLLMGKSLRAIAKEIPPSRHTIRRWVTRFTEQFALHKMVLCTHWSELGRACDFGHFWQSCLSKIPLSLAMCLCHQSGEVIP